MVDGECISNKIKNEMKIEDQVCSFNQGVKLKELGVLTESYFVYRHWRGNGAIKVDVKKDFYNDYPKSRKAAPFKGDDVIVCSAFTVAELGVMLPTALNKNDGHNWSWYHRHCWKGESVGYSAYGQDSIQQDWFKNEAEARSAMLIYLLENKIITVEEVNQRLTSPARLPFTFKSREK